MIAETPSGTLARTGQAHGGGPDRMLAAAMAGNPSWRGVKNAATRPFDGALKAFGAMRASWRAYCGDRETRRRVLVAFWSSTSAASLLAVIAQHMWPPRLACPLIALYARYISRGGRVLLFPIPF